MNCRIIPLPEIAPSFLNACKTDVNIKLTVICPNFGMDGNFWQLLVALGWEITELIDSAVGAKGFASFAGVATMKDQIVMGIPEIGWRNFLEQCPFYRLRRGRTCQTNPIGDPKDVRVHS